MGRKPRCTLQEFKDIVKYSIKSDMRGEVNYKPLLLEGPAGIGKTSSIYQLVKELTEETGIEFGIYEFDAATRTANDLWGIPFPKDKNGNKVLTWIKDEELPRENSSEFPSHGIFFCTELTSVQDEQLKVALLDLLSNHRMTGYELPKNWYIVADGNGKRDGNVYSTLSFPIRNRLGIFEAEFSKEVWLDWCRGADIHEAVITFIESLPNNESFLTYNPDLEDLSDGASENNYVCATPRSWNAVSDKLKLYEKSEGELTPRHLKLLIQASIGDDIGADFFEYYMNYSPEVSSIIPDILNCSWKNDSPTTQLPEVSSDVERELIQRISEIEEDPILYNIFYYLSEYGEGLDSTLQLILGSKSEGFKKEFINHSIKSNNLGILGRINKSQYGNTEGNTDKEEPTTTNLIWD